MEFQQENWLREIDLYFAKFMAELSEGSKEVFIASLLLSKATGDGHVCLDLSEVAGKEGSFFIKGLDRYETIRYPKLKDWIDALLSSNVVGRPGEYKPLILDDKFRLYMYRYWRYEDILIQELKKRVLRRKEIPDFSILRRFLNCIFSENNYMDSQVISSLIPIFSFFCVITGGPGTGKTSAVVKILSLLIAVYKLKKIFLSAPTGKASARLKQAVSYLKQELKIDSPIKDIIPTDSFTIHRMLGYMPSSSSFLYNSENKLSADVVVVDEASMVDLPLMSKLMQALPEDATLIILGDKDQLSSVEPGSVLGDICAGATGFPSFIKDKYNWKGRLDDCIVEFKKSYRFDERSGIYLLSQAINKGEKEKVIDILINKTYSDISFKKLPKPEALKKCLEKIVLREYSSYLKTKDPYEAIMRFESFRILCPIRWGNYGVRHINSLVEQILQEHLLIYPNNVWYPGRPILITENSYELGLFNGDIGIIMEDPDSGDIRAFFIDPDGNIRKFLPIRLPAHETVFAMTVHKSQGSEFDNILFILPDIYAPVITRELIYTAVTRAKKFVEIWGTLNVIEKGVDSKLKRSSGLRDALWTNCGNYAV